ncbi:26S proteasome non-ATPase regulatory subunit 2 [Gurleya vavrai]
METIIQTLHQPDKNLHEPALQNLLSLTKKTDITTLKLLNDHRTVLTDLYNSDTLSQENKKTLSDILSLIYVLTDPNISLTYRLLGNTVPLGNFGHQYIKKLLSIIITEKKEKSNEIIELIIDGIKFLFSHNCEVDGIDFLLELNMQDILPFFVDDHNFERVETYVSECLFYERKMENVLLSIYRRRKDYVKLVILLFRIGKEKLQSFIRMEDVSFGDCNSKLDFESYNKGEIFGYEMKKNLKETLFFILRTCEWNQFLQIIFILGRINYFFKEKNFLEILNFREESKDLENFDEKIKLVKSIINNKFLPTVNRFLHKDLQIISPFSIEKFIKGIPKLENEVTLRFFSPLCVANALVHCGFGYDSLLFTQDSEYNVDLNTISENDKLELISIYGSLGLIRKNKVIQYQVQNEENKNTEAMEEFNAHYGIYDELLEENAFSNSHSYKKSGALLALALQQNFDDSEHSLFALLSENLNTNCRYMKISSLLGLQYLYCGTNYQMSKNAVIPLIYSESVETCAMACFTLGSIFHGSGDSDLLNYFMTAYIEKKNDSDSPFFLLIVLGMALLFMNNEEIKDENYEFFRDNGIDSLIRGFVYLGKGRTDVIEDMINEYICIDDDDVEKHEDLKTITENQNKPVNEGASRKDVNVEELKNEDNEQERNDLLEESLELEEENEGKHEHVFELDPIAIKNIKAMNLIAISLISLNDTHTRNIVKKLLINQFLKDKNQIIPMCLSFLYASEPDVEIIDLLSRGVNYNTPVTSIFGLGLIGAGSNNTRIQNILEQQYQYQQKNSRCNSALKISQGLINLGKGTLTLSPLMFDKTLINKKCIIGLLALTVLSNNDTYPVFSKHGYLIMLLNQCIGNKFVVTINNELKEENITVRVGRPVQTVGMAGKPKGISAIVTHDSPIIVQSDEKAALYEEEGFNYEGFVEDIVVVKKNN